MAGLDTKIGKIGRRDTLAASLVPISGRVICCWARGSDRSNHGGEKPSGEGFQMLLLAADSPQEKFGWIEAIGRGSRMANRESAVSMRVV